MNAFLGIDIGSSAVKIGVYSADGSPLAHATRSYPTFEPHPGYKEQNPEDWWKAAAAGIRTVLKDVPSESILAVGLTGHISSLTFLADDHSIVRPSLSYQDRKAVEEVKDLYSAFSREELSSRLGIDLPPSPTWPLPRLLWLKKHEPRTLRRTRFLLQAKDYILLMLTGEFASDSSSCRGMVNLSTGQPAEDVFARLGLPVLLPRLCPPQAVVGTVRASVCEETGLRPKLPVVTGWNDLNACVLGCGLTETGECFNVGGTSEHIGMVTTQSSAPPQLVCAPFLPGKRLLYGVTSCGGGSLQWFNQLTGKPFPELLACAKSNEDELLFLPYLNGERAPIWDPNASGVFVGLRSSHRLEHLTRAVLDGVAFSLRQNLELVEASVPERSMTVTVTGGPAEGEVWNQIKADIFAKTVITQRVEQAGALGAAMLAAVGADAFPTIEAAATSMASVRAAFHPQTSLRSQHERLFAIYKSLYPSLKETFSCLNRTNSVPGDKK